MSIAWMIFSALALCASIAVVTRKNPIYGAVWLMLFFFSLSGIYVFLQASFLAASQLFIYVGAVIVLYIFVITMLDFNRLKEEVFSPILSPGVGIVASGFLFLCLTIPMRESVQNLKGAPIVDGFGSTPWIANELYRKYPFQLELASILLIIALVGAFALTQHLLKAKKTEVLDKDKVEIQKESISKEEASKVTSS